MRCTRPILVFLLLGAAAAGNVWADRGHVHFGVTFGPYWGPWYYAPPPYPYYYAPYAYPPTIVVERAAPQVYIEQQPAPVAAPPAPAAPAPVSYWYYCPAAKGYYPYVRDCPSGWQKVMPQPPGQP